MTTLMETGVEVEVGHHEVATGGQCEIGMKFKPPARRAPTSSCGSSTSSRTSRASTARRRRSCPSRSSATTAAGCTRTSRSGRRASPSSAGDGYAGLSRHGAPLHRRNHQAREVDRGAHRTRRRTPTGAWCPASRRRSTSRTRAATARLRCRIPITGPESEDPPRRGALPRPELQPVPRVQRDADGRARRHPEQDRPGRSARQGHLRALARRSSRTSRTCRAASKRRSTRSRATTSSSSAATSSRRTRSTSGSTTSARRSSHPMRMRPTPYEFYLYFDI